MTKTLQLGPTRLSLIDGGSPSSVQVASGWDPQGERVILVRFGKVVAALTVDGAAELGDAIEEEVQAVRAVDALGGHPA